VATLADWRGGGAGPAGWRVDGRGAGGRTGARRGRGRTGGGGVRARARGASAHDPLSLDRFYDKGAT